MTTRWRSSGNGARLNSPRLSVANWGALAQGALPTEISLAMTRGQGTQARQPSSSGCRDHSTLRSPLMANGRPIAALTRSLSMGLARFQSKVAIPTASTATRSTAPPTIPIAIFLERVMVMILAIAAGVPRPAIATLKGYRGTPCRPGTMAP
ncbi:hypothetical protein FQZ97_650450 [compost metagenome]